MGKAMPCSAQFYTRLFGGQEVSQLDLRTWDQACGEATALHRSISSRLSVASSMFCTTRVRWKLLARDPLIDRINAGVALLPLQGVQELTMAPGGWEVLEGMV